jgi:hypothetical protein
LLRQAELHVKRMISMIKKVEINYYFVDISVLYIIGVWTISYITLKIFAHNRIKAINP